MERLTQTEIALLLELLNHHQNVLDLTGDPVSEMFSTYKKEAEFCNELVDKLRRYL